MFLRTASRYAEDVEVVKVVGRDFVEIVEENQEHSERAERAVRSVVEPLVGLGVDKIVLGCTHYPFLRPLIEQSVAGHGIEVIDSGEAVARRVKWLLERYDIATKSGSSPEMRFCTFADEQYRKRLEEKALAIEAELK
jgi:glutamate racemase